MWNVSRPEIATTLSFIKLLHLRWIRFVKFGISRNHGLSYINLDRRLLLIKLRRYFFAQYICNVNTLNFLFPLVRYIIVKNLLLLLSQLILGIFLQGKSIVVADVKFHIFHPYSIRRWLLLVFRDTFYIRNFSEMAFTSFIGFWSTSMRKFLTVQYCCDCFKLDLNSHCGSGFSGLRRIFLSIIPSIIRCVVEVTHIEVSCNQTLLISWVLIKVHSRSAWN